MAGGTQGVRELGVLINIDLELNLITGKSSTVNDGWWALNNIIGGRDRSGKN